MTNVLSVQLSTNRAFNASEIHVMKQRGCTRQLYTPGRMDIHNSSVCVCVDLGMLEFED
jgi:hypothetical protein